MRSLMLLAMSVGMLTEDIAHNSFRQALQHANGFLLHYESRDLVEDFSEDFNTDIITDFTVDFIMDFIENCRISLKS